MSLPSPILKQKGNTDGAQEFCHAEFSCILKTKLSNETDGLMIVFCKRLLDVCRAAVARSVESSAPDRRARHRGFHGKNCHVR